MSYLIKRQPNGSFALHNPALRETMHPGIGPWQEATELYVKASGLEQLLAPRGKKSGGTFSQELVVFDVGLGGAANSLAALSARKALAAGGKPVPPLRIVSFEQDLEPLRLALEGAEQLRYPVGFETPLEGLLTQGRWEGDGVVWELRMGDFNRLLEEEPQRADVVFYDPFSPRSNPEAWSVGTLTRLFGCRRPGGDTVVVTYSSSIATRAAFLLAGFYVGRGPASGKAHQTTVAATRFSLLEFPLNRLWLADWKRDGMPWPALTRPEDHRAVRKSLLAHNQWDQFPPGEEPAYKPVSPHTRPVGKGYKRKPR